MALTFCLCVAFFVHSCGVDQDFRTVFSRNQALGGELDDANKRAAAAEAEALESKQELVRQVRWLSPSASICLL